MRLSLALGSGIRAGMTSAEAKLGPVVPAEPAPACVRPGKPGPSAMDGKGRSS